MTLDDDETVFALTPDEVAHLHTLPGFYAATNEVPFDTLVWTLRRHDSHKHDYGLARLQRLRPERSMFFDPAIAESERVYVYTRAAEECIRPGSEADGYAESLLTAFRLLEAA